MAGLYWQYKVTLLVMCSTDQYTRKLTAAAVPLMAAWIFKDASLSSTNVRDGCSLTMSLVVVRCSASMSDIPHNYSSPRPNANSESLPFPSQSQI